MGEFVRGEVVARCRAQVPEMLKTVDHMQESASCEIISAFPLTQKDKNYFESLIKKKLHIAKDILFAVDPNLVAGMRVRFTSGYEFDFSLAGKFNARLSKHV